MHSLDPVLAQRAFQSNFGLMASILQHSLLSMANAFYSQMLIPEELYKFELDMQCSRMERASRMLNSVYARIYLNPSSFNVLLGILEREPFHEPIARSLKSTYGEFHCLP